MELPASAYGVTDSSHTAHVRGEDGRSLCGKAITGPVPTGQEAWKDSLGYHDGQHCIACDREFRRVNGTHHVTFEF